jgi:hypothetical protein
VLESTQGLTIEREELYGSTIPKYFGDVMTREHPMPQVERAEDKGWRVVDIDGRHAAAWCVEAAPEEIFCRRFLLSNSAAVRWVHDSIAAGRP